MTEINQQCLKEGKNDLERGERVLALNEFFDIESILGYFLVKSKSKDLHLCLC